MIKKTWMQYIYIRETCEASANLTSLHFEKNLITLCDCWILEMKFSLNKNVSEMWEYVEQGKRISRTVWRTPKWNTNWPTKILDQEINKKLIIEHGSPLSRINGTVFNVSVGVRQGCVMSPPLFSESGGCCAEKYDTHGKER